MKVTVRYFASIREALGHSTEVVDTASGSVGALRDELLQRGGAFAQSLARGKAVRIAVDQVMSDEAAALREGTEVAFFPPVTGG